MEDFDRERVEALLQERADDLRKRRIRHRDGLPLVAHVAAPRPDARREEVASTGARPAARAAAGPTDVCTDCLAPIAPARLKAIPGATRCLRCQRGFEGLGGRSVDGL